MQAKTIAIYSATGCRTCEHVILDINYQVHPLGRVARIAFWPYALGSQLDDLERLSSVDVCLFAGAIRTDTDRQAAEKLRQIAGTMVAVGACAAYGGMPALANVASPAASGAQVEVTGAEPSTDSDMPALNGLEPQVSSLNQVVPVDYFIPGCPPTANLLWAGIQALLGEAAAQTHLSYAVSRLPVNVAQAMASGVLPPQGTTFAGEKAVCASCSRQKEQKCFEKVIRPYEKYEATGRCLLEQGLLCQGIATREGCGGLCTGVGVPCRGCFGKPQAVYDPGAKMVAAVSSTFDSEDNRQIEALTDQFHDLVGTFYRYTLASQCVLCRNR